MILCFYRLLLRFSSFHFRLSYDHYIQTYIAYLYMKSHNLDEDVTDYEKAMKIILKRLDYDVNQYWRSYDQMNDIIINKLK